MGTYNQLMFIVVRLANIANLINTSNPIELIIFRYFLLLRCNCYCFLTTVFIPLVLLLYLFEFCPTHRTSIGNFWPLENAVITEFMGALNHSNDAFFWIAQANPTYFRLASSLFWFTFLCNNDFKFLDILSNLSKWVWIYLGFKILCQDRSLSLFRLMSSCEILLIISM